MAHVEVTLSSYHHPRGPSVAGTSKVLLVRCFQMSTALIFDGSEYKIEEVLKRGTNSEMFMEEM